MTALDVCIVRTLLGLKPSRTFWSAAKLFSNRLAPVSNTHASATCPITSNAWLRCRTRPAVPPRPVSCNAELRSAPDINRESNSLSMMLPQKSDIAREQKNRDAVLSASLSRRTYLAIT